MTAPSVLCAATEIALNRFLRLETSVIEECARLSGRCMEFTLPSGAMSLAIEFIPSGVRVMPAPPAPADVRVCATPSALMAALRSNGAAGVPTGLIVEGDVDLLAQFRAMVARVGFDPEEWLAPMFGGVAAHRVVGGLKRIVDWTRGNSRRMADHGAEYLREETYDLARGRDVGEWMNEVDDARDSLDRLETRLRRLEQGNSKAAPRRDGA